MDGSCSRGLREVTYRKSERRTEGQVDGLCIRMEWRGLREGTYRQSEGQTEGQVDGSFKDAEGLVRIHTDRVKDGQRDRWTVHVGMQRV